MFPFTAKTNFKAHVSCSIVASSKTNDSTLPLPLPSHRVHLFVRTIPTKIGIMSQNRINRSLLLIQTQWTLCEARNEVRYEYNIYTNYSQNIVPSLRSLNSIAVQPVLGWAKVSKFSTTAIFKLHNIINFRVNVVNVCGMEITTSTNRRQIWNNSGNISRA